VVKLARILRDYDDAGALNELISLWGFVDGHVFLTKAGHVGLVYAVRGIDYEGLTHNQRQVLVHQVEAGLRMLDEQCRIYQYVVKRAMDPIDCPGVMPRAASQRGNPASSGIPERAPAPALGYSTLLRDLVRSPACGEARHGAAPSLAQSSRGLSRVAVFRRDRPGT
jgi:hypothetical protein